VFWFAVAMVPLFAWAGWGLGPRERLWVFGLLGTAVAARLAALLVFFLVTHLTNGAFPVFIPDEDYIAYRARMLRLIALGVPLAPADYLESANEYGQSGIHYVYAYVQLLLGEAPYAVRLLDVALYLGACVGLYRLCRRGFGSLAALGGLVVVLFLPSSFAWSIALLKEVPVQSLVAVGVIAAAASVNPKTDRLWHRALGLVILVLAAAAARTIRPGAEVIIVAGGVGGAMAGVLWRRPLILAVVVLAAAGVGIYAVRQPGVQDRVRSALAVVATSHLGYVRTPGENYRLLDSTFYRRAEQGYPLELRTEAFTPEASARYAIRAVAAFFLYPLPWQASSRALLAYLPEQLLWTVLVALALVGTVAGLRSDPVLTLSLVGVIACGAVIIGLASGNFGTLIRHRSSIGILVPWLAAVGAIRLASMLTAGRSRVPGRRLLEADIHAAH
jgi:hypothetical protein